MNKIILFSILAFNVCTAFAQEQLYNLTHNARLNNFEEYLRSERYTSRANDDTLELPFFDDFSEPFSRRRDLGDDYPNANLWIGNTVYVNNHMAINPISQGVATFDGLDEKGQAYQFGSGVPTLSDSLLSKPIDLSSAEDTVYLTFYYQAQGMGDEPEDEKVLQLDFRKEDSTWVNVWEAEGYFLFDNRFKLGQIAVVDSAYLYNGFQFRFRNYTAEGGATDHWHLDYIELNEGRNAADTLNFDVAFMCNTSVDYTGAVLNSTSSLLKEFNNMPWSHFKEDPGLFSGDSTYFALRNNTDSLYGAGVFSTFIYNAFDDIVYQTAQPATPEIFPNVICGNENNSCSEPDVVGGEIVPDEIINRVVNFTYPTNLELSSDSMYFTIIQNIDGLDDDVSTNDKWAYDQLFYNYYAYDDGTAEVAYGLSALEIEGSVAVRYNIKKLDTLRAIQLYVNPTQFDLSNADVDLAVWTGGNEPETMVWRTETPVNFQYTEHVNYFYHYFIDSVLVFPANQNVWVGWIQYPEASDPGFAFSVGLDRRTDRSENTFYRIGNTWNQTSIPGTLMIRPVFGKEYTWVGVDEATAQNSLTVYPNPTDGQLFIQEQFAGQLARVQINVFDLSGKVVHQEFGYNSGIDLEKLQAGVYLLQVATESSVFTERIVLK